jgi:hypothetical protein
MPTKNLPPILEHKHHAAPAVFLPENLLREARRQRMRMDVPRLGLRTLCGQLSTARKSLPLTHETLKDFKGLIVPAQRIELWTY